MTITVVIRTKNEHDWLKRCLTAVAMQDYPSFDVVVVDNESIDRSRQVAARFGCRVISIPDRLFGYGRALNLGLEGATGDLAAIVSGHCIPAHDQWLTTMAAHFDDPTVAGVYGRQIPLPDSHPFDKRDLWTTFGVERRVQRTDYFFHNANSMIRQAVWREIRFDEQIKGVEDRDWAKKVLACGHRIVYEPLAAVYHHHGIHQGRDPARAERVVRVIEMISDGRTISDGGVRRRRSPAR
jgi:glycosyltransferase involved in cell wall biosynthesis